ncbi:L-alanine dehydrogenase [Sanguibacter gelidistatuariae]|uniref:Alanine dehydrogenase n=1 Tax=Sanguibacter gelidistatuariae TaxID=1814289 RepID=A0A1G6TI95_9MICO|nr:alanine dehydrogenase [Sanguibacter gelidistatuariae]SDD28246.1 L-alanine dehydrogenase [Sanguibacter gelidistatuariae]
MRIGIPAEVKDNELRVALTADGAHHLVRAGHQVLVQAGAGAGSAISDADYAAAGARIVDDAASLWRAAQILCKVKEPLPQEYPYLRPDLVLFAYLHLAANGPCTQALLDAGTTAIAYETVRLPDGSLPLLAPMSEIAGRLAPQVGAFYLLRSEGGSGILMGGVPGTRPAKVVIIGGGTAGRNAAQIAVGMRASVTVIDLSATTLAGIDTEFGGAVRTVMSTAQAIDREVSRADLVIGAVLVPGARAPRLVSNDLVSRMPPGSVLVDIAVDQGGCFEGTHPTTHTDPTYRVHQSTFYAVANMPGTVPVTSTQALTNATLPYLTVLAAGLATEVPADPAANPTDVVGQLLRREPELAAGLMTQGGRLVSAQVALAHGMVHAPAPGA